MTNKITVPLVDRNPFSGFYLDLDGVFADFDGRFFKITGKWPHQVEKNRLWKIINSDQNFFGSLDLMENASHLWEYSKQFLQEIAENLLAYLQYFSRIHGVFCSIFLRD